MMIKKENSVLYTAVKWTFPFLTALCLLIFNQYICQYLKFTMLSITVIIHFNVQISLHVVSGSVFKSVPSLF